MPAVASIARIPLPVDAAPARISAFLNGFSLEAARLDAPDVASLRNSLARGTPVYLTSVPGRDIDAAVEPARLLRQAGFEPVPHLAVRNVRSAWALESLLSKLAASSVRRLLVIAGDRDRPAGPYASALDIIESGLLQRHGIREIGVAAYPEGHPRIPPLVLERSLALKIEAAEQTGLSVHIVTQFCFDLTAISGWIARLRDRGYEHPVRVGMAGPASLTMLMRYAQHCGVRASMQGIARNAGLLKHLVGTSAPDGIVRPLAEAAASGRLGRVLAHFYSFGGTAATGRWAAAAQAGHVVTDRSGGFRVDPP